MPCTISTVFSRPSPRFSYSTPATSALYTLSLHDALPISVRNLHGIRLPGSVRPVKRRKRRAPLSPFRSWHANCQKGSKRSEEHTTELQSPDHLVCRLLLEKKNILAPSLISEQSITDPIS